MLLHVTCSEKAITCLTCSRALSASRASLALCPNCFCALHALCPMCSCVFRVSYPICSPASLVSCSRYSHVSRASFPTCSCASYAPCLACPCALCAPSHLIHWMFHVPISAFVLLCFHASRDFFEKLTAVRINTVCR